MTEIEIYKANENLQKMQDARDSIKSAYNAVSVVLENNPIDGENYASKMIEDLEEMRFRLRKMYYKI